jgi:hypothetical protein
MLWRTTCWVLGAGLITLLAFPSHATSVSPYEWRDVQKRAQDADVIVVGRHRREISRGDPSAIDAKTLHDFDIERVIVGAPSLAGTSVRIEHAAADAPFAGAKDRVLVFMREEGARHAIDGYGVVNLVGDDVDMWLAGKPWATRSPLAKSSTSSVIVCRGRRSDGGPRSTCMRRSHRGSSTWSSSRRTPAAIRCC